MTYEPIDIIWHYLILFTLLLELVILNLDVKKGHTECWQTYGAVLHYTCNITFYARQVMSYVITQYIVVTINQ